MSKTFLEFENKSIDVNGIKDIEKNQSYNDKENCLMFNIEINKGHEDDFPMVKTYKFEFRTEELRDDSYELLKIQLEGLEWITFL